MKKYKYKKINVIQIICFVTLVVGIIYISYYIQENYRTYKNNREIAKMFENMSVENKTQLIESNVMQYDVERVLKVKELQKENSEIVGWIEIENTNINYPLVQANDNNFYITHNYKKEKSKNGAIFVDKDYSFNLPSTNLLIYGHNNKNGTMFEELMKYKDEDFYKTHKTIRVTTLTDDFKYEIISVFLSRVYYKHEKDVFRYYYFVNANNQEEFNYYVENSKKYSLYDTGKSAVYGDELLTLSTCEYSQVDGRLVVIAKKI